MKSVWRAAGIVASAVVGVVLMGGPAWAVGSRAVASTDGAAGRIDFRFISSSRVDPISMQVTDTRVDGRVAKLRIIAGTGTGTKYYAWRTAVGDTTEESTYLYDSSGVDWIQLQVCRVAPAGIEDCGYSDLNWNPYG
ncbi:hypothetical protein ACFWAR_08530 [Streptomyces sp. NPDC059917]|uniref:hypothetical protein n=1 Tax=Streptomyces sp. NPDC059917 TaxID=3347002 RepID=UPI0036698018